MAELLLEIFGEEIPAKLQNKAVLNLQTLFTTQSEKAKINFKQLHCYATPQRLVLIVKDIVQNKEDTATEKRGPRIDAGPDAISGFLKTNNLTKKDLIIKEVKGQEFYFANVTTVTQNLEENIIHIINYILHNFPWPKTMRWDESNVKWIRPIRNILCLLDGKVIAIKFGSLVANNISYGHHFMSEGSFGVKNIDEYKKQVASHKVILDAQDRKNMILTQISSKAQDLGLKLLEDEELLNEVVGLVEYPEVMFGTIDQEFLELPKEVLISAMKTHQRYFSLLDKNGKFAPYFVIVGNVINKNLAQIISGNEKVLRARLYDAKFFYEQDKERRLESRVEDLKQVVFHDKLGTLYDKANRAVELTKAICQMLQYESKQASRAALLAKTDLTTHLVDEFPELQGIIGRYYALNDKEPVEVANAILEHYMPVGRTEDCPSSIEGAIVSIADKLDSIVGLFFADEAPTSSKDPYGLRRSALGIIRIILDKKLNLSLSTLVLSSVKLYRKDHDNQVLVNKIIEFFYERFRYFLKDEFRHDFINAVLNSQINIGNIYYDYERISNLKNFFDQKFGKEVFLTLKRVTNFIQNIPEPSNIDIDEKLLVEKEEKELNKAILEVRDKFSNALIEHDFSRLLNSLAILTEPVNNFCDQVTVMAEDNSLKSNRIKLLFCIHKMVSQFANFSFIELT
jgi:glycyl-tRNA synthetase beta chain